ncbi:3-ketoacyl-CoA thiolase, mitochondrial-like [Pollicipes pollicipes]|uniref:3-ketoacyl-CoA thiolase, mitochondrial-like n=1 Tax=Pollicipes pollicipes TaxID=41117 RepID=UPI0018857371|nr:3-ketoacyl-CoA thiolase, mitochondrial-like [Pollicipes pollicipes]XP_037092845.1 3-ketoacyl-CoA thiolase, mitochondrial-like [Pollicipes pollicipes]XP_037093016.1 3-ketoacyl-CoA thiolase, mitochondrial-like [Pollicipes pollicipes]
MSSITKGIFIVGAKRTPFGAFCGKLSNKTCTDLQEVAARAALQAAKVKPELVDSVVIGNVLSCSSVEAPYISRHTALRLGCDVATPALTVNRLCGSGFQAVVNGAHDILMGDSRVVLTGGSDNMTQAPHAVRGLRTGVKLGTSPQLEDMMWEALTDQHCRTPMGVTAENLAEKYGITRQDADEFAIGSQQKWKAAHDGGLFQDEMAPVTVKVKRQDTVMDMDEHPKPQSDLAGIGKLPSVFKKGGTVTAATASGICDGAGAVVLASEAAVKEHGLTPLARLVGYSVAGVEPTIMGIGPAPAIRKLLEKAGLTLNDIGLVEINEAFAPQTLACQRELDLDPAKLNVNGGAIALGHPLAASGARITAHLVHQLRRRGEKYAIGSACIGGGQGIALLLEAV